MKIDYCEVHDSPATKRDPEWCWSSVQINQRHNCRMVPMRLIPDNALLLTECSDLELTTEFDHRSTRPTKGGIVVGRNIPALDGETP